MCIILQIRRQSIRNCFRDGKEVAECSVCQSTGKIKNRKYNQSKSNEYKEGREKFACRGKK